MKNFIFIFVLTFSTIVLAETSSSPTFICEVKCKIYGYYQNVDHINLQGEGTSPVAIFNSFQAQCTKFLASRPKMPNSKLITFIMVKDEEVDANIKNSCYSYNDIITKNLSSEAIRKIKNAGNSPLANSDTNVKDVSRKAKPNETGNTTIVAKPSTVSK